MTAKADRSRLQDLKGNGRPTTAALILDALRQMHRAVAAAGIDLASVQNEHENLVYQIVSIAKLESAAQPLSSYESRGQKWLD